MEYANSFDERLAPVIENGKRLLTNDSRPEMAKVYQKAKEATGAPVTIGEPGGPYRHAAAGGLWVEQDFAGDLSAFWAEARRVSGEQRP